MRPLFRFVGYVSFAMASAAWMLACTGDDTDVGPRPKSDAGLPDATVSGDAASDAAREATIDAGPPPTRAFVTLNNTSTSELVVVDPTTLAVQGRLTFPGFIGATYSTGNPTPFLLMQSADIVAQLDPREPWKIASSWNVRLSDRPDGGYSYADPAAVIVVGSKAYVPRYTRNTIAVLDLTQPADAGAPAKTIDLTGLRDGADSDAVVDMTAAAYVPSKNLVYVLIGNVDRNRVINNGFNILCTAAKPSIVAIDPATDQVVSLGGSAPGGGIALSGYNPVLGAPLLYEAAQDRLLVLQAGCNVDLDGGAGPMTRREVEAVSLTTKTTSVALDLNAEGFPGGMIPVSPGRAIVSFFGDARIWDTATSSLGPSIAGAPDLFASDGRGALIGPRTTFLADGGSLLELVRLPFGDAGALDGGVVVPGPFTDPSGFPGGAEVWPTP